MFCSKIIFSEPIYINLKKALQAVTKEYPPIDAQYAAERKFIKQYPRLAQTKTLTVLRTRFANASSPVTYPDCELLAVRLDLLYIKMPRALKTEIRALITNYSAQEISPQVWLWKSIFINELEFVLFSYVYFNKSYRGERPESNDLDKLFFNKVRILNNEFGRVIHRTLIEIIHSKHVVQWQQDRIYQNLRLLKELGGYQKLKNMIDHILHKHQQNAVQLQTLKG